MSFVTDTVLRNTLTRLRDEVLPMIVKPVTYTVIIDQENTNCETACTYADDAAGMTKGASAWDTMPIFKDIKPCVFNNGEVAYYLKPNNWNEQVDGTAAVLTGTDGDVMIEFPKFAYRIYTDANNKVYVTVSNDSSVIDADNRFTYDAFSRLTEGDLDYFYFGAYKGYFDTTTNKLRSIAGVVPTDNKNINAFRTAAQANGAHYQQSTYAHIKAIQCLYLIKYGNRNGQEALGFGNVSNSATLVNGYNALSGGTLDATTSTATLGMNFGSTSVKTQHMRVFGIEDFWGNINEWVDGFTTDASYNIITSWNSFSGENVTETSVTTTTGISSNLSGQAKYVQGTTDAGFMIKTSSGSTSTCWADSANLGASRVLYFGGDWLDDLSAGPFCLFAYRGASNAAANIGARLNFS